MRNIPLNITFEYEDLFIDTVLRPKIGNDFFSRFLRYCNKLHHANTEAKTRLSLEQCKIWCTLVMMHFCSDL